MPRLMSVASAIAHTLSARDHCATQENKEWESNYDYALAGIIRDCLPSGSGFDSGTTLLDSKVDKLAFKADFHHMNDGGYYDGWTSHTVIVTPAFIGGFDLRVTGRNKRDIKGYIAETFNESLSAVVDLDSFYPAKGE